MIAYVVMMRNQSTLALPPAKFSRHMVQNEEGLLMRTVHALAFGLVVSGSSAVAGEEPISEAFDVQSDLLAADGKPPFGVFDVTAPDGQIYREVIREDGTFSSTSADGSAVEGVWEQRRAGVFCSKPLRAPSFRCKYEEINADGI